MPSGIYERTAEHRKNISNSLKGKVFTEEHKRNISKGRTVYHDIPKCIDCNSVLAKRSSIRCKSCSKSGNLHPLYGITGENSHRWNHGIPSYRTIHGRVVASYGNAYCCENEDCDKKSKNFDWSNKDHKYSSIERKYWQQLCKSCHKLYDNEKFNTKGQSR